MDWNTGVTRTEWTNQDPSENLTHQLLENVESLTFQHKKMLRQDQRKYIQAAIDRRDNLAAHGKLKRVITSLFRKQGPSTSADVVTIDGKITSDPEEIHNHLTKGWEKQFLNPAESLPTRAGLEPSLSRTDHQLPSKAQWEHLDHLIREARGLGAPN